MTEERVSSMVTEVVRCQDMGQGSPYNGTKEA